jgi:hypothetical protein
MVLKIFISILLGIVIAIGLETFIKSTLELLKISKSG